MYLSVSRLISTSEILRDYCQLKISVEISTKESVLERAEQIGSQKEQDLLNRQEEEGTLS